MFDTELLRPWFYSWSGPAPKTAHLLCFPSAGGSAMMFAPWAVRQSTLSILAAQLPGRGSRLKEKPQSSLLHLASEIADCLAASPPSCFALYGHSMGALLAFEVARELERKLDVKPIGLLVSGAGAPHLPATLPPTTNMNDEEFCDVLRRLNGTPCDILESPDLLQLLLPMIRSDFRAVESYCFIDGRPLSIPIVAAGGDEDQETRGSRLEAWRRHTRASFMTFEMGGDHFFPFKCQETFLDFLEARVNALINQ